MTQTPEEALAWQNILDKRADEAGRLFAAFVKTIGALRHPDSGCPWDLEQDHKSLRRYMLEEAYEASEAMLAGDSVHLLEELGDVLLQVVLNAQVAADGELGTICDVIQGINSKMLRRHPHVFGGSSSELRTSQDVRVNWDKIKASEKAGSSHARLGFFADQAKVIPALTQALKIGKRAHSIDFDWGSASEVWRQVKSELDEFEAELAGGDTLRLQDELGDVLFSLAQMSRHLGLDPEVAAQQGNIKFLKRFAGMEKLAIQRGLKIELLPRDQLELLWQEVKLLEKQV